MVSLFKRLFFGVVPAEHARRISRSFAVGVSLSIAIGALAACAGGSSGTVPLATSPDKNVVVANAAGKRGVQDVTGPPPDPCSDGVDDTVYTICVTPGTGTVSDVTGDPGGGDGGCPTAVTRRTPQSVTPQSVNSNPCNGGGGGGNPTTAPLTYAQRIYQAAIKAKGPPPMNTKGLHKAPAGDECAAAMNQILINAGLSPIDATAANPQGTNSAGTFASDLINSGYSVTTTPVPGDIVELRDNSPDPTTHVGTYMGNGTMLSNSSSAETFSWQDTVTNEGINAAFNDTEYGTVPKGTYTAVSPVYYHHN